SERVRAAVNSSNAALSMRSGLGCLMRRHHLRSANLRVESQTVQLGHERVPLPLVDLEYEDSVRRERGVCLARELVHELRAHSAKRLGRSLRTTGNVSRCKPLREQHRRLKRNRPNDCCHLTRVRWRHGFEQLTDLEPHILELVSFRIFARITHAARRA